MGVEHIVQEYLLTTIRLAEFAKKIFPPSAIHKGMREREREGDPGCKRSMYLTRRPDAALLDRVSCGKAERRM